MSLTKSLLLATKRSVCDSTTAALITVSAVKGSAPRGVGTSMLVLPNDTVGTIGGGRLEYVAIEKARTAFQHSNDECFRKRFPLGDSLGQCCGGSVELLFERVQPNWQQWLNAALLALDNHECYERVVDEHYTHKIEPLKQRLILCGAGHVGKALVHVLANAPIHIHWLDEREAQFPNEIPLNVRCEVTDTAGAVIEQAPAGSAVLITTHRHDLDFELAAIAIDSPHLSYCGLIGSKSKRHRFERQWRARRGDDEQALIALERLVCPIGAFGLTGKEPEVVAISVAFEILGALGRR